MKERTHTRLQPQAGVALVAALFVLVVLSTLVIAVLADVQGELRMSAVERTLKERSSLRSLGFKLHEHHFAGGALRRIGLSGWLCRRGYFFTTLGSGFRQ